MNIYNERPIQKINKIDSKYVRIRTTKEQKISEEMPIR